MIIFSQCCIPQLWAMIEHISQNDLYEKQLFRPNCSNYTDRSSTLNSPGYVAVSSGEGLLNWLIPHEWDVTHNKDFLRYFLWIGSWGLSLGWDLSLSLSMSLSLGLGLGLGLGRSRGLGWGRVSSGPCELSLVMQSYPSLVANRTVLTSI